MVCDYALPPEESSPCNGLDEFNLEALIREVYEIVKAQIEAEEGFTKEVGSRDSEGAEEDTSLRTEDGAYKEAGRTYGGDMREGAERATLLSCGKGMTMEKVEDYEAMSATSRVGGNFRARLPETLSGEASVTEACVIRHDFGWDAIRTWIGRPKQDRDMNLSDEKAEASHRRTSPDENGEQRVPSGYVGQNTIPPNRASAELKPVDPEKGLSRIGNRGEKAREGSSTPISETTANQPPLQHKTEEKEGGSKGTMATINEGIERSIQEVAEDTEAESTNTDVGEERVRERDVRCGRVRAE